MKPIKLGIIGCGVIGSSHVNWALSSPHVQLVAVADLIPERTQKAAAKAAEKGVSILQYPNDVDLLKNNDIEAVVLAMPVFDRTPVAFKALKKQKHIIIEKPIAARAADVEKMIALQGNRVVSLCSARISHTGHGEAARKVVASGALGNIRVVRFRAIGSGSSNPNAFGSPPPWRQSFKLNGGGILVNWSCYDLNYLMHILDWKIKPQGVFAQWWPVGKNMRHSVAPKSDADSHFIALIQCKNRVALSMERAEFSAAKSSLSWEIIGDVGTLHLPMVPFACETKEVLLDRFIPGQGLVQETIPDEPCGDQGVEFLANFYAAVREKKKVRTDLRRALLMQKITDAIYASAKTGKSVDIKETSK